MTIMPIVIAGDPVLHQPTQPVQLNADGSVAGEAHRDITGGRDIATLVEDMFETMDRAHGVGLAANQVGVGLRLFVYHCPDIENAEGDYYTEAELQERGGAMRRGYVINPQLTTSTIPTTMPHEDDDEEGCLSVPGYSYPTGRAQWARVVGIDLDGNPVDIEGYGFFARCLQHEVGHLDGFLYTDMLTGRWKRMAKRTIRDEGWTRAGHTWTPGVDADPFGHDDLDMDADANQIAAQGHDTDPR